MIEGFQASPAKNALVCAWAWYSPKHKHAIRTGEMIYWRTEKGRPMGYCEDHAKELAIRVREQEKHQQKLI